MRFGAAVSQPNVGYFVKLSFTGSPVFLLLAALAFAITCFQAVFIAFCHSCFQFQFLPDAAFFAAWYILLATWLVFMMLSFFEVQGLLLYIFCYAKPMPV
jgi:hypothetical protein